MKLFDIAAEYREAADKLMDLDLPEDVIKDTLESLSGDLEQKARNIAVLIDQGLADVERAKEKEKALAARRKAAEARVTHLKQFLLVGMQLAKVEKIEGPFVNVAIRVNPPAVDVFDEKQIPAEYMVAPPPPPPPQATPDKTAIAAALKAGKDVPGARLVRGVRLEVK